MDQLIGKKLDGRYELLELIGAGGMALVYRAKDLANGNTVAVKVLKEQFLDNDEILQRFKNESRAISMMDHPNIVKVLDVSVWDKTQFLVMELVKGVDLKRHMEACGGRLPWKEAVDYTEQTLQALQHAHEHGIVHRDIKPQNLMLVDGTIKVMDFGIARFSRSGVHTSTDKAMGSVHYISPEQARGDVTDNKSDVYSVGVMLYEMLTGSLPFDGDSNVAVAIKQISEPPRPPHELMPDLPEGLEAIVLRAMEKDPDARYDSAQSMLEDIGRFKENPSIQFAYQYMQDTPTRYMDTVKEAKPAAAKAARPQQTSKTAQKPKKKKGLSHYVLPVLAGMAFAFLVGSAILVYMIFHFSGNSLFSERADVELPSFVGMNVDDVINNDEYKAMFVFTINDSYRNDYEAGKIYDQSPKSGKMVKEGHEIILRVSRGVQIVTVPDVVGYTKDEAVKILSEMDLSVLVRYDTNSLVPLGQVIRTDPEYGTDLSSGQQITVFVSAEKVDNMREVPNLIGLTSLEEATKLLNQYSLALGTATGVESDLPEGTIIEQSVPEGTSVYTGSMINVSYSLGYITREWTVTVKVVAEDAGIILNGQKISYTGGSYTTKGGGTQQSFTFKVSTQASSEKITVNGESRTITGNYELMVMVPLSANRPAGCTCPDGEHHSDHFDGCALNQSSSNTDSESGESGESGDSGDSSSESETTDPSDPAGGN